jgi:hypothetical protein
LIIDSVRRRVAVFVLDHEWVGRVAFGSKECIEDELEGGSGVERNHGVSSSLGGIIVLKEEPEANIF